jgi:protein involved in polysaccharide export with SLBB domain
MTRRTSAIRLAILLWIGSSVVAAQAQEVGAGTSMFGGPAFGSAGAASKPGGAGAGGFSGSAGGGATGLIQNGGSGPSAAGQQQPAGGNGNAQSPPFPRLDQLDAKNAPSDEAQAEPLPPQELNSFQRFVQANTGRVLPIFGTALFERPPRTFAPVGAVPVPADYVIGPGDEILLRSSGVLDFEIRLLVDRDGQIVIPKVGTMSVAGVRMVELERYLTQQVSKSFRNFTLSATLGQLRSIDIYVVGQARRPGKYTISSLTTLVNAIFVSGGPNANGTMRKVRLVRPDRSVVVIDLYDFLTRGDKSKDVRLLPGDVIVFPPSGPRVAVLGATNAPAIYELISNDTPIKEVLAVDGGLSVLTTSLKAQLERIDPTQRVSRQVESFALDAGGIETRLRDGDVLTLLPISPQFGNAVTLRGNVAVPLRYPFTPGMRIRDLIPERDALVTPDYYQRKNLLVQHEDEGRKVTVEQARRDVRNLLDEVNWEYAVIERLDASRVRSELIPFDLGRAVLQRDDSQNLELKAGDVVTIFSTRDLIIPRARQNRLVRIEGEVGAPGIYAVGPGETLPQLLARVGGTTPEAYVFGTSLTRDSIRKQQEETLKTIVRRLEDQAASGFAARQANVTATDSSQASVQQQRLQMEERQLRERLQRLRNLKPTGRLSLELEPGGKMLPDLPLEDGDRIVVPPRPAFIAVSGSVYNENVLLWREGRTVEQYLQSAGLTDGADVDTIFVLRADGSIASRGYSRGWFGRNAAASSVLEVPLAPGDTIVVPEKADRETTYGAFMRNLKDWTQVVYQLGLGAAAIKVLRD